MRVRTCSSTGFRWAVPDGAKFIEGDVGDHNLVLQLPLRNCLDAILHVPARSWCRNPDLALRQLEVDDRDHVTQHRESPSVALLGVALFQRGRHRSERTAAVKRAAKTDLTVHMSDRRPGDPAALVAGADRIRELPDWVPRRNNLDTMVEDALSWEKRLKEHHAAS